MVTRKRKRQCDGGDERIKNCGVSIATKEEEIETAFTEPSKKNMRIHAHLEEKEKDTKRSDPSLDGNFPPISILDIFNGPAFSETSCSLLLATQIARDQHLGNLQRLRTKLKDELDELQQNSLLWHKDVRTVFNSLRLSFQHLDAVCKHTEKRSISTVPQHALINFQTVSKVPFPKKKEVTDHIERRPALTPRPISIAAI